MNTVMDPEVIEKTKIQLAKECMRAEVYEEYKHLKERDNPKKPVKEGKFYKCVCGAYVLYDDEIPNDHDKFCGVCGQRIDWGDLR